MGFRFFLLIIMFIIIVLLALYPASQEDMRLECFKLVLLIVTSSPRLLLSSVGVAVPGSRNRLTEEAVRPVPVLSPRGRRRQQPKARGRKEERHHPKQTGLQSSGPNSDKQKMEGVCVCVCVCVCTLEIYPPSNCHRVKQGLEIKFHRSEISRKYCTTKYNQTNSEMSYVVYYALCCVCGCA